MPKAILIPVSGDIQEVEPEGYEELTNIIGGMLEGLRVADDLFAYIDEEGKLKGLPINPRATALCTVNQTGLAHNDCIVGPMLLFGPCDNAGRDTDISQFRSEQILNMKGF